MLRYLNAGYRDFNVSPVSVMERFSWEIYLAAEGALAPVFDGQDTLPLQDKYVWVMPVGLRYGWRGGQETVFRYAFHFSSMPAVFQETLNENGYFGRKMNDDDLEQVGRIYQRMDGYFHEYSALSGLKIEREMMDLVLLILNDVSLKAEVPLNQVDERRVESALTWYREHMSECPTIEAVADFIHISPGHLRRIFRRVRGRSPHQMFLETRLAYAKELLSRTSQTLAEISRYCGFSSASDFCRVFFKHTGVSPHKWRTRREY